MVSPVKESGPEQFVYLGLTMPLTTRAMCEIGIWRDVQIIENSDKYYLKRAAAGVAMCVLTVVSLVEAVVRLILAIPLALSLAFGESGRNFYTAWCVGSSANTASIQAGMVATISSLGNGLIAESLFSHLNPFLEESEQVPHGTLLEIAQKEPEKMLQEFDQLKALIRGNPGPPKKNPFGDLHQTRHGPYPQGGYGGGAAASYGGVDGYPPGYGTGHSFEVPVHARSSRSDLEPGSDRGEAAEL